MNLEQQVIAMVAEAVGVDASSLGRATDFEADLAVDSIRMMTLLSRLTPLLPDPEAAAGELSPERLGEMRTLGHLLDFFEQNSGSTAPNAVAPRVSTSAHPAPVQATEVPIAVSQYLFLLAHFLCNSSSLGSTVRVRGEFDVRAANTAWRRLIERHVNLQTRFVVPRDTRRFAEYRCVINDSITPPPMRVEDWRERDCATQEHSLEGCYEDSLNRTWSLQQWPLHEISITRLADDEFVVMLANEHLISDGLGNQKLLHEFLELYRAEIGRTAAELPPPTSIAEYTNIVEQINRYQSPEESAEFARHVAGQPKGVYFWKASQLASMTPRYRNRRYRLDAATSEQLHDCTRRLRVPLNSLLVAAYLRALGEDDSRTPILQIPTSGTVYPTVDATHLVGCFAGNLSLGFSRPSAQEQWPALVARVHAEIQRGLAWGFDRVQTRQMAEMVRDHIELSDGRPSERSLAMMRRAGSKSNLYIPFTGHSPIRRAYGALQVIDNRAGGRNVPGAIDVLQEFRDGTLYIWVSYDGDQFDAAVIDDLMSRYQRALVSLAQSVGADASAIIDKAASNQASPPDLLTELCRIASDVVHMNVQCADAQADLEADLGLDSLGRIRIITRAATLAKGRLDRDRLFAARTLAEMVEVLGGSSPAIESMQRSVAAANGPAIRKERAAAIELDAGLPEIPYVHIARQAERTPELVAVEREGRAITYRELHIHSNQLGQFLQRQGVKAQSLVGVMTRRGPEMLTAVLAVLKAGGAYVPVDPDYPVERMRAILGHAEVDILITENAFAPKLKELLAGEFRPLTLVVLDEWAMMLPRLPGINRIVGASEWLAESPQAPSVSSDPDDLMVVLYTSGSTGRPNGVALNHRGYFNRLRWHQRTFDLRPGERVAQKTSCCFDISVWELLWPLMVGGTVCAVERDLVRNPWQLAAWMTKQRINVMHFVPSMFGEFVRALASEPTRFADLNWLIFSGEALAVSSIRAWIDRHGLRTGLANLYGPTEASIDVTCHLVTERPGPEVERIPIGRPIDNTYIVVLDPERRRVAPGAQGELCIGGVQLAQGYLRDPQKTAEAFITNPLPDVPWPVLYRTGDLASELPDGSFDYHGRLDSQVKVRGFRIELGEIEATLDAHDAIDEAAVLAVDFEDDKKLIAWVVGRRIEDRDLRAFVGRRLPDYMVPAEIVWLDELPKNHNGKLDRKALLAATAPRANASTDAAKVSSPVPPLHPLGPAQRWLIRYFGPPYRWVGYNRFTYKQPLHIGAFREALASMVRRHSALRTVFVEHDGQWLQRIEDTGPQHAAEFLDGTYLTPEEREAAVRHEILRTSEQFTIDRSPLWRLLVVKTAADRYEIVMMGHHLVGDLVSNNVLFAQLWRRYAEIVEQRSSAEPPAVRAYSELPRQLATLEASGALKSHIQYWRSQFESPACALRLQPDFPGGENTAESAAVVRFSLTVEQSRVLLAEAKELYRSNLYTLLLAPLYRTLAERTGQRFVVLSQRMSGRDIGDARLNFFESVGDFAINYPLGIEVEAQQGWDSLVERLKAAVARVPMKGVTFDWLSDHWPQWMYPDDKLTPVRVNYLGNIAALPAELFETRDSDRDQRLELPGQRRSVPIEIHLWTAQRQVHVSCTYSSNQYRPETITRLADGYLAGLRELIATADVEYV
jgi:fengycin family lipopeptide synthetase B